MSRFAAIVPALAVALALAGPGPNAGRSVSSAAHDLYADAEKAIAREDFSGARRILEEALTQFPDSGTVRRGGHFEYPYFPHYLLGVALMGDGRYDAAEAAFERELEQGEVQASAEIHADLQQRLALARSIDTEPPIARVETEVLSTRFVGDGEKVEVRFHGVVVDPSGIASLTVEGRPIAFRETADGFLFDAKLELDSRLVMVELVAKDSSGNVTSKIVSYDLPPLELGEAAESIHAVLVGVDAYDKTLRQAAGRCDAEVGTCGGEDELACYALPDLKAAAADAERFYELLRRRGVPERNLHLLISDGARSDATLDNVRKALDRVKQASGETVIFYFSGHGVNSRRYKNLMLLSDTTPWECGEASVGEDTPLEASSLGVEEVELTLMEAAFDERYVILDACRSNRTTSIRSATAAAETDGIELPGFRANPEAPAVRGVKEIVLDRKEQPRGTPPVVYYATWEQNVSVEWTQKRSGYFTWYLLQGLRRDLSLHELKDYVQEQVRTATRENHCEPDAEMCAYEQAPYLDFPKGLSEDYEGQKQTFVMAADTGGNAAEVRPRGVAGRFEPVPADDRYYFTRKRNVAVVVGVADYPQKSDFAPVRHATEDADDVAVALVRQGFDVLNLRGAAASREAVLATLRQAAAKLDETGSTFVFHFVGQGASKKNRNYLAASDTRAKQLDRSGLRLSDVLGIMESSPARRAVAFVDASRAPNRKTKVSGLVAVEASAQVRVLLAADAGGSGTDDAQLGHGLFSYFVVRGLDGAAAGFDGFVTFADLVSYVGREVAAHAQAAGQVQQPVAVGEVVGMSPLAGVLP